MRFEWDEAKRATNLRKHGVDFADATPVFDDPLALTIEDFDNNEVVMVTMGCDALLRVLVVVWTERLSGTIRIISARKAEPHECRQYES
nr:BrnT family toxin [Oceanococcus sp. HetDA_MAG_MS8]